MLFFVASLYGGKGIKMLKTVNLTKQYKQGDEIITAIKSCSFTVNDGEFVAIVGTSGSGKSTLLQLCGGLLNPTDGAVYIDGEDITMMTDYKLSVIKRRKIGFVFQQYNLLPFLTAKENIILPSLADRNDYDGEYLNDLTDTLKISGRLKHLPGQMSGGEQQRVAIARALKNKPSIILADEPTGNLDKNTANELLDLLVSSMKKYNQTVMLITHDPAVAARADRILKIDAGVVAATAVVTTE
jgi:putative ABC transport system ATP-binding protein